MDAKFQAILPHADPAGDGEGAAAALGALALSKQRRPQRQNAFAHFRKVPLPPPQSVLAMDGRCQACASVWVRWHCRLVCWLMHSCTHLAQHADSAEATCWSVKQAQCSVTA